MRPTADRARESVFNVLVHRNRLEFEGVCVLDLFAGTGALGLEALSRGAAHATFVDNNLVALDCIRENVQALGMMDKVTIQHADATQVNPLRLSDKEFSLALLDPPYHHGLAIPALKNLAARGCMGLGAAVVMEIGKREALPDTDGFEKMDERRYGAARIVFLRYFKDPKNLS